MTLRFTVIETTKTPLWDYGWFDLTRFKIEGPIDEAVEAWAKRIRERGEDIQTFEVADSPELEVAWSWVWCVYREFVSVDFDRTELSVAVIGYD